MYVSGSQYTLENRMHQLPTTTGELNSFLLEGIFHNFSDLVIKAKLDREYIHQAYTIGGLIKTGSFF